MTKTWSEEKKLAVPGIEPGLSAPQARVMPLDHTTT